MLVRPSLSSQRPRFLPAAKLGEDSRASPFLRHQTRGFTRFVGGTNCTRGSTTTSGVGSGASVSLSMADNANDNAFKRSSRPSYSGAPRGPVGLLMRDDASSATTSGPTGIAPDSIASFSRVRRRCFSPALDFCSMTGSVLRSRSSW